MLRKNTDPTTRSSFWKIVSGSSPSSFATPDIEETLNALDMALIYFGPQGELLTANCKACTLIPGLGHDVEALDEKCQLCKMQNGCFSETKTPILTLSEFLVYVFDNSMDTGAQNGLLKKNRQSDNAEFNEIIDLKDQGIFLVRAIECKDGGVIVEMNDISDLKDRNDFLVKLNRENLLLTEAIQSSRKGIFVAERIGSHYVIQFTNQSLGILLDGGDQLIGSPLSEFLTKQFKEESDALLKAVRKVERITVWHYAGEEDGERKWLELSLSPSGANDHLIIGFLSDQTQHKLQEERLLQTQKLEAIGRLAAGVAHDFNNVLAIVDGYARMAKKASARGESINLHVEKITNAVEHGSSLTRQMLTFGKHRVSENRVIDLCEEIRKTETLIKPLLGVRTRLNMALPDHPVTMNGTHDMVTQIMMNICINAHDAMPEGGAIKVELVLKDRSPSDKGCMLKISDTGTGMPQTVLERIFDPFFTTKGQGKGTGLGLSMVYGLVQQMKGDVWVDSEEGKGTCFTIWFPVVDQPVTASTIYQTGKGDLAGKTVLLAEDETDLLEIMRQTLEGFGMKVFCAANGNEALEVQDEFEGNIDFLLTDMVMPHLGGLELASLFHQVRPETKILFMSGYPVRNELSDLELPEDAVFMPKPIREDNLRRTLETVAIGQDARLKTDSIWK